MALTLREAEARARSIISGQSANPKEVLEIAGVLRSARKFSIARRVLEEVKHDPSLQADAGLRLEFAQKLALCTYKDPDLETDKKLTDAYQILRASDDLDRTKDQETLGLAGAIYKRLWEYAGKQRDLETSFAYYYRGYEEGIDKDYGYTAINAAFVLDLLADLENLASQPNPVSAAAGTARRDLGRKMRGEVVDRLTALANGPEGQSLRKKWWFLVTIGEACFGLDDVPGADLWLQAAASLEGVPDWEQESSARQLAALLKVKDNREKRGGPKAEPGLLDVLRRFLGTKAAATDSVLRGKIGVALSGGGFRASLYHIGVLAKLAEADLLRHVEYLSCVSGGSIIGAHYYLEVQKRLSDTADGDVTTEDYVKIVRNITRDFLDGVKTNIRTRIAAEWLTNLKMIFLPAFSRTKRAGELYESEIFSRVNDGHGHSERWMSDLKFVPKGEDTDFSPKDHNWRRKAKVPILVLNATTLNTGHNWQFTGTWMGEPPANISTEVDANYRLRRFYYESDSPPKHGSVRLGYAVAASACVPGIFEPLTLVDAYERSTPDGMVRPLVRLVDGGVYDNQGVAALLEQGCSVLIVSDASGQMDERDFPSNGLLGVPLRANSILQSRVRASQYADLAGRLRGGLLKGLLFVHLKKGLETDPVDWIGCQDPYKRTTPKPLLPFGVQRHIQRHLAAIRTDLDSFSEAEAYALMSSGYLMTEQSLESQPLGFPVPHAKREDWPFLAIEPMMKDADAHSPLVRQLSVANSLFFKVWLLMRQLQIVGGILIAVLVGLLAYAAYLSWEGEIFRLTVKDAVVAAVLAGLSLLSLGFVGKIVNYRKTAQEILVGIGMATVGFAFARLHLHVFDRLFLWQGSLKRLLAKRATNRSRAASASSMPDPL